MDREQIRLECLKLASARLGPNATVQDLYREANILLAWVDGFDRVDLVSGKWIAGKNV